MPQDYDKYLYHFTTAEKALCYILPSLELKLSSISHTNDPKENKLFGAWDIFEHVPDFQYIKLDKPFTEFINNKCKVACFSHDYKIRGRNYSGYDHPAMWAHYANRYSGVCLVFYKRILIKDIALLPDTKYNNVSYGPSFSYPRIDSNRFQKEGEMYLKKYLLANSKKLFFKKHSHWSHEHEARIFHIGDTTSFSILKSLAGIYIGYDFDTNLIKTLKSLMPNNTCIEKITIDNGRLFPIDIEMFT